MNVVSYQLQFHGCSSEHRLDVCHSPEAVGLTTSFHIADFHKHLYSKFLVFRIACRANRYGFACPQNCIHNKTELAKFELFVQYLVAPFSVICDPDWFQRTQKRCFLHWRESEIPCNEAVYDQ